MDEADSNDTCVGKALICFIIAATRVCVRKIFVGIVKIDRTTRRRVVGFDLNTFLFNRVK